MSVRVLCCGLLLSCASASQLPEATTVPKLALSRSDGQASTFQAALGGSVAVIDLWATWCTACERERPKLARLDAAYREQGLRVIGLNVGESASQVSAYLAEHPMPYAVYLDPDFHAANALGGQNVLPTILVVDRGGRIVHRSTALDVATLSRVKSLLAATP